MRAEDFEADFTLEKAIQTGAKLSAGLLFRSRFVWYRRSRLYRFAWKHDG